jgi:ribonuclease-3
MSLPVSPDGSDVRRSEPRGHDLAAGLGLGEHVLDPELLLRALTHRSWCAEHRADLDNERLELLGDAVLDLAVTAELHARDPEASEGVLSRRRAQLVRESTLAQVARELDLGDRLRLGRGESASGGAGKDSLLADALEAVIGAVFLSAGYEVAAGAVVGLLDDRLTGLTADLLGGPGADGSEDPGPIDAKTALQERLAVLRLPPPEYRTVQDGPDHAPTFRAEVLVDGKVVGSGAGGTKKAASQAAAEQALRTDALG